MRTWMPALLIATVFVGPARGEEPHTFRGKTVEGWLAVLRDQASTDAQRREAAVMLGCFGSEAKAAAPDLIDAVRKGQLRPEALAALVSIGAGAEATVPLLVDQMKRNGGWLGVGPGLGTFHHAGSMMGALPCIGAPIVPALRDLLDHPDPTQRLNAAYALGEIGPAARAAVPALIRAMGRREDGQDEFLEYAVRALGRIGPEARAAVPALHRLLGERNDVFDHAVWALDRIGSPAVPFLLDRFLRDGDPYIGALLAFSGPRARAAVPALRAALADKRVAFRINAAIVLARIDPSATDAIPVLIEGLKPHDEPLEIGDVSPALARFGPDARAALPALIGWVNDGTSDTCVLEALVKIDPEGKECVPALIRALGHEDGDVVRVAANCLGLLGPRAKAAVPALAAAVSREFDPAMEDHDDTQATIARALRRIGPDAKPAIPALIRTVRARRMHENNIGGNDRWADCIAATAAAETLGSFGAEARGAIPALTDALRSYEVECDTRPLQRAAALALGQIQPEARVAVPALRDSFEERDETGRNHAEPVIALYQLAPDSRQVAERWLLHESPVIWKDRRLLSELEGRAMVLGAIGRTSFESDWVTRRHLEQLDFELSHAPPLETEPLESFEWWFEEIGRLGVAARMAVPRLKELRNNPSPFVRMWAAEAFERIAPPTK